MHSSGYFIGTTLDSNRINSLFTKGNIINNYYSQIDIRPTLKTLLGTKAKDEMHGVSFAFEFQNISP